ncbi:MAG: hypothetical protein ACRELE_07195 [Gemmatimonadales bacterium]
MNEVISSAASLHPRLQLRLGAIAELGREAAGSGGRRSFDALVRDTGRPVVVTLHPPCPRGPQAGALQARIAELRALQHGGLQLPIAVGELDDSAWVVEAVPSDTAAADRIAAGPVPLRQGVSLIRDLARTLAAMHRRNVFHGAIDLDVISIGDRGARLRGTALSLAGTRREDLDALAQVAWALLSGERRPISVRKLSTLRRGVVPGLDVLCASLLAADPADRPQRAEAVLGLLDAVPSPRAGPTSWIVDVGMSDTRSRHGVPWLLLGAAAAILIILLAARS